MVYIPLFNDALSATQTFEVTMTRSIIAALLFAFSCTTPAFGQTDEGGATATFTIPIVLKKDAGPAAGEGESPIQPQIEAEALKQGNCCPVVIQVGVSLHCVGVYQTSCKEVEPISVDEPNPPLKPHERLGPMPVLNDDDAVYDPLWPGQKCEWNEDGAIVLRGSFTFCPRNGVTGRRIKRKGPKPGVIYRNREGQIVWPRPRG